jgi:hypothetical protein
MWFDQNGLPINRRITATTAVAKGNPNKKGE